jgi:hypothetical protein
LARQKFRYSTVERDVKLVLPTTLVNTLPPSDPATRPQCHQHRHRLLQLLHPLEHNLLRYKHLRQALQAFRLQCLNHLCMSLFPQIHRQTLPLRPSCKTPRRISVLKAPSAGPSEPRRSGGTSYIPGFHGMSSRHRSPNTVLRDVAAKRRHVEGSPTFWNASFRSHVRYIMHVMIAAFTRSCSTLRPQAHENTDPTFIFIPTAHFLFLRLRECLLASASLWIGGAAQRNSTVLPDFQSLNMDHLLQTSHGCGHHHFANPISVLYYTTL